MDKFYYSPECEEIAVSLRQILCESGNAEKFDYDPDDPHYIYTW